MSLGGKRTLVLGGTRSGKSAYAESLAARSAQVEYLATAPVDPHDAEWSARIAAHRSRRPAHWSTIETAELAAQFVRSGPLALIDSITSWLTRTMDVCGCWDGAGDGGEAALSAALSELVGAWAGSPRRLVAVSDEVGLGVVPETRSGRVFRDRLGELNRRLAERADTVWLVVAGIPLRMR
jgi:adenosylcobinamide kinase/adenosylcobinamide-phosphate guanylyltransferase